MIEPFTSIKEITPRIPGWCSVNKALNLASLVLSLRPKVTVEIGVFAGKSCVPMIMAHEAIGKGKVFAIDPWSSAESVKGQGPENAKWWGQMANHSGAEALFRKTVMELYLEKFVEIIKETSDAYVPPPFIDILHIDGNHSEQATNDVNGYAPNVLKGGFIVMDDLDWDNKGPLNASRLLLNMGFRELYTLQEGEGEEKDNYAVFQRIS